MVGFSSGAKTAQSNAAFEFWVLITFGISFGILSESISPNNSQQEISSSINTYITESIRLKKEYDCKYNHGNTMLMAVSRNVKIIIKKNLIQWYANLWCDKVIHSTCYFQLNFF